MKLIIDIPEEIYQNAKTDMLCGSEVIVNAIKNGIPQEPKTEWIPVSKRLPELPDEDYCLCCDKDGYMTIGFVSKWLKQWCFDDERVDMNVIAWMPLPKPYKESEDDK